MTNRAKLSLLDFCTIYEGETAAESMARSVELAQVAEKAGYSRIWYTEHHNMPTITSSSPAVLIPTSAPRPTPSVLALAA